MTVWAGKAVQHVHGRDGPEGSVSPLALRFLNVWLVLYSIGQVFLLLLFVNMLLANYLSGSVRRKRNPILINMVLCGLLYSVPPCLLYYFGDATTLNPPHTLCLVQQTLKHGGDPMILVASLALVIEFVTSAKAALRGRARQASHITILLLAAPYLTFLAFSLPALAVGVIHPDEVFRLENLFYCTLNNIIYDGVAFFFELLVVIVSVVLEIHIICVLRRSWRGMGESNNLSSSLSSNLQVPAPSRDIDFRLFIRVAGFTFLQVFFILISLFQFSPESSTKVSRNVVNVIATLSEASLPIWIFLIFGLRTEFMLVFVSLVRGHRNSSVGWQTPSWLAKTVSPSLSQNSHALHPIPNTVPAIVCSVRRESHVFTPLDTRGHYI